MPNGHNRISSMSEYKIYSSSAGSGKTFTLTREYLRLLLEQNDKGYFRHILAITFTNDAALEMKNRVLQTLRHIAIPDDPEAAKSDVLKSQLLSILGIEEVELQKRAYATFHQIIQDYADFHIRTIDSFTNQISQTFALDLNIPYNYEILFENEKLIEQAILEVFQAIGTEDGTFLTQVVQDFANEKLDAGKSWQNLIPELVEFVADALRDKNYALIQKNDGIESEGFYFIKGKINGYLKASHDKVNTIASNAINLIESAGLIRESFKYGKSGVANLFYKIVNDPKDAFDTKSYGTRVYNAIDNDDWCKKGVPEENTIDEIKEELTYFIRHLIQISETEQTKYFTFNAIGPRMHYLAMLSMVLKAYYKILHENNQANLSDINQRIARVVANEPIPYIFERLGERYNHILIDEFQDTSEIQYFNLLPLVGNALSKGYFNMLVGDPKQSIYRFRGSRADLMIHLYGKDSQKIVEEYELNQNQMEQLVASNQYLSPNNLKQNFRSKKEIVKFNNDFFSFIRDKKEIPIVKAAYADIEQEFNDFNDGAHVEVRFIDGRNKAESTPQYLEEIKSIIDQKLAQGYVFKDIAVLVRKGANARLTAEYLKSFGLPISSSDSLLVKNNLAVAAIIAAVHAFLSPLNIAAQETAILLYCRVKGLALPQEIKESAFEFFEKLGLGFDKQLLSTFGLYQIHESVASRLGVMQDGSHLPFIFTLLDEVQSFVKSSGNNFQEWQKHWNIKQEKLSLTSSAPNAIQVGTIHKAKGLEYPVVIVPFIDWDMKLTKLHWFSTDSVPYTELTTKTGKLLGAAPVYAGSSLSNASFASEYEKEDELKTLEELNTLYVAFTRPVDALYMITSGSGIGQFLKEYCPATGSHIHLFAENLNPQVKPKVTEEAYVLDHITSNENIGNIAIQSALGKVYDGESQLKRGNLVHALFSLIHTKDDLDEALRKMIFDGLISDGEKAELKIYAQEILVHPQVAPFFEGEIEVENERDILVQDHKIARPDRVVFKEGKVIIIDFKTGLALDSHHRQIKKYGELYKRMGYEKVELVLLYLDPLKIVKS
ncbi:ATP-dependent exoDNAse (exonuclease V) beta subunit (contains helicase and exonuclease domains) [Spirosomataceae bacterium TFI 002]|nr:ATP-dependent exoDNAse (exonuclease V) beta subunit (contains helicase and exonuclease domains) [Spirosomataceae bacterium TFI 002]